ncbi:hypothetical protein WAK64_21770 [Bacillus spongiae]|uniref:IS110 family transposase n=1 Tax=Bacillus spongiae TaxID=2683610 RepID=A0ABU8HKI2_9BACI
MFFLGIDIGKRHHEVELINDKGNPVGKALRPRNQEAKNYLII